MNLRDLNINKYWTLFLDRDGVINKRLIGDYIKTWEQFEFLPGALEAIRLFSEIFGRILVVSNQQGIGKKLMSEINLEEIHKKMTDEINAEGGRIDKIYYSPHLEKEGSFLRKPNVGMALKARRDFPEIRLKKSVMAGDSVTDMVFGHRINMITVFISKDFDAISRHHKVIDFTYPDLISFAKEL
jgi:D-glycero-D-manno-heptose 1,7-bisphosphate phosphatase